MYESSAIWTFAMADGTTITFNDTTWPLICEDVTGNDSPNVRENTEELPELDGATVGNFYYGARPMTWSGLLLGSSAAARNQAASQLQAATRGLRGNITVTSQASGMPAMQTTGRLQNLRITRRDGIAKSFQLGIICPDPRFYSTTQNSASGTGSVSTTGAAFSLAFPINFGGGTGAVVAFSVANAGNFTAPATITLTGPVDNPTIYNSTTGEAIYLDPLSLVSGEYVTIDTAARTVIKNDGTSMYGRVKVPDTSWFSLVPGNNAIQLRSTSVASTATLTFSWRDAWA